MESSPAAFDVPRHLDPAFIGVARIVPISPYTEPIGYAYPVQSASHFSFAGTAIHGSIPQGDHKNEHASAEAEHVVLQSTSANGVKSSDYTSTSTSVNGNEKSSQFKNDAAMDGRPATTTTNEEAVYPTPPRTPAAKRAMDSGVVKTPTFAAGPGSEVQRRRNINRRQRASTPHPAASPTKTDETTTTSPDTTPEQSSKTRRKRRIRKPKVESTAAEALARSEEKAPTPEEPLQHLSVSSDETPVVETVPTLQEVPEEDAPVVEKALPEAMTMEIEYPSFQTTAILEFEPDFPQPLPAPQPNESPAAAYPPAHDPSVSTEPASQEQPKEQETSKPQPPKPQPRRRNRLFRRFPRPNTHKHKHKPPPKILVEADARPRLVLLFEKWGVHFANDKRPYLQFTTLAAAARERDPEVDVDELRGVFVEALKWDGERSWPGHQVMISPIDLYFAGKDDGKIKTFQYPPTNEASVEFFRLAVEAGWIKEVPEWDTTNWWASLDKFEKIWSKQLAKDERKKFRDACFFEFDHLLGHIFRDTVGQYPNFKDSSDDSSPPSTEWELAKYDHFLKMFGESPCVNIRESKEHVRELNLNLYDLLDWIRNPDNAARPERFANVKALAEYSFSHNKVFPFLHAIESQIASPFLRRLTEHWRYKRTKRPRTYVVVSPATDATKMESSSTSQGSPAKEPPSPSADEKSDSTVEEVSTETTEVDPVKNDEEEADEAGAGASLFTLSETAGSPKGIRVPTRRRRRALNRFAQDEVVSPGDGEVAITATQ